MKTYSDFESGCESLLVLEEASKIAVSTDEVNVAIREQKPRAILVAEGPFIRDAALIRSVKLVCSSSTVKLVLLEPAPKRFVIERGAWERVGRFDYTKPWSEAYAGFVEHSETLRKFSTVKLKTLPEDTLRPIPGERNTTVLETDTELNALTVEGVSITRNSVPLASTLLPWDRDTILPQSQVPQKLNEAVAAYNAGDYARCAALCETVLKVELVPEVAYIQGVSYVQLQKLDDAIRSLLTVITQRPEAADARNLLDQLLKISASQRGQGR